MTSDRHPTARHRDGFVGTLARWLRDHGLAGARELYATLGLVLTLALGAALAAVWGFLVLAEEVVEGETAGVDAAIMRWVGAHHTPWLDRVAVEITTLGNGAVVLLVALVAAAFLHLLRRRTDVLTVLVAVAGSTVLTQSLKTAFGRERPDVFDWLVLGADSTSFPSGHSLHAAVLYPVLAAVLVPLQPPGWIRRVTVALAVLLVALVPLSRVWIGVHYPTDVTAGVAVGYAWGVVCVLAGRVAEEAGGG